MKKVIHLEQKSLSGFYQQAEKAAVIKALDTVTWHYSLPESVCKDVKLSAVAKSANRLTSEAMKVSRVEEILESLGFKVSYTHGIKYVRANPKLLDELT